MRIFSAQSQLSETVAKPLQSIARTHYENFPVGSFLLPKELRKPIHLVYAFARVADDIVDEGDASEETRLTLLYEWENQLKRALAREKSDNFFRELADMIAEYAIPPSLLSDLITAFRMDARGTEYDSFDDLKFYCRHSANPIGRILLHVLGCADETNCRLSDAVCTALQLTNFWQDLGIDIKRNRDYIPNEDFRRFGVTKEDLRLDGGTGKVRPLLKYQVDRTREFFLEGKALIHSINKKFAFELKLTHYGGMRMLEKIELMQYDTLHRRPALSKFDWAVILMRSLTTR
jgi:squalene synthase HpnC